MEQNWLTIDEVADRLDRPVATVRRWASTGQIRGRKSGRQWLIDPAGIPTPRSAPRPPRPAPRTQVDLDRALVQLEFRDLREPWVPDILNHADSLRERSTLLATAASRLNSAGPFDAVTEVEIPKSPFFTRPAQELSLEDRLAYHAAVASMAPRIERQMSQSVYSARLSTERRYLHRKGRDLWLAWRTEARRLATSGYEWMVKTDITAYFDSIEHRLLFADIDRLNPEPSVALALKRMLSEWATVPGRGLPQGPDVSRSLANLYLVPIDEQMNLGDWKYLRFMDDFRVLGRTRRDVIRGVKTLERECRRRGLVLSAHKTDLLVGKDAVEDLEDAVLDGAQYLFEVGAGPRARSELRQILKRSLARTGVLDTRHARFALYRLNLLRDDRMTRTVVGNLEALAPLAPIVAEYLYPFLGRKAVHAGMVEFFHDSDRNTSAYLSAWLLAAYLDRGSRVPEEIIHYARRIATDHNQPGYHRVIAANAMALGRRTSDISWLEANARSEFDPELLRGYLVALARVSSLSREISRIASARVPRLAATVQYVGGRASVPSLVFRARLVPVLSSS